MGGRPVCINNAYKIAQQFFRSACTALKKVATSLLPGSIVNTNTLSREFSWAAKKNAAVCCRNSAFCVYNHFLFYPGHFAGSRCFVT
jgi:hypothetical protein